MCGCRRRQLASGDGGSEGSRRVGSQRSKLDGGGQRFAAQREQKLGQGMGFSYFFCADGSHDQQTGTGIEAQEKMKPLQRFLIGPLQVVDHKEQRRVPGQQGMGQRFEKVLALPAFTQGSRCGHVAMHSERLGQQASELGKPGRIELCQVLENGLTRSQATIGA